MSPHIQGSRYILIISDYFIKILQTIPLTDQKAATVGCGQLKGNCSGKNIIFLFLLLIEYVAVMLRKKNQIFYMAL